MPSYGMTCRTSYTAGLLRPRGDPREDLVAQLQERPGPRQPALEAVGQQREAGANIAHEFRIRKEHLLDRCRKIAPTWRTFGPSGPMKKGGFSTVSWPIAMIRSARSIAR